MSPRLDVWLWLAHRGTGALLAPLILVHLVTIILGVQPEGKAMHHMKLSDLFIR